jgi:hypothetical protein
MTELIKQLVNEIEDTINEMKIYVIGYGTFIDYMEMHNHVVVANNEEKAFEIWKNKVYEGDEDVYEVLRYEAYKENDIDYCKYGELLNNSFGGRLNIVEIGKYPISEHFNMATG